MEYAIPDVPYEVASQMAKVEFQRREALKVRFCPCPFGNHLWQKLSVETRANEKKKRLPFTLALSGQLLVGESCKKQTTC